jgi:hypothetical protein
MRTRDNIGRELKRLRGKLWDALYNERSLLTRSEYNAIDTACLELTEALRTLRTANANEGEQNDDNE